MASDEETLEEVTLEIDELPPSTNKLYITSRSRRFLSTEGKRYKRKIAVQVAQELPMAGPFTRSDAFSLEIELRMQVLTRSSTAKNRYKRFDVSNRVKVLEDALCESLGIDDSQILELRICKIHTTSPEKVVARLRRLTNSTPRASSASSSATTDSE